MGVGIDTLQPVLLYYYPVKRFQALRVNLSWLGDVSYLSLFVLQSIFELVSSQSRTMVLAASQRLTALGSGYTGGGGGPHNSMGRSGEAGGEGSGNNSSVRTVLANVSKCGTCGGRMNLLADASSADQNRGGLEATFVHCVPCQKSYALPRKGKLTALMPTVHCPLCNFQV